LNEERRVTMVKSDLEKLGRPLKGPGGVYDIALVEGGHRENIRGASPWEEVESTQRSNNGGVLLSSLLTLRARIGQGFLVRTFYQFNDGGQMRVTMSQCYVPDPNENWVV
jgi:hypothetical protein